ncbi:NBS-LRR-like resistance protein [Rhynchospora pubera]|uniref:NBS-LRR-like resistance protein n=1 Tax=Rhynchospora pubera TaxID=906938 RepID=A0AAV8CPB5_9POAL|nr:NBS-LRR-like resistance protein [Rhynchospora pubera]
MFLSPLISVAVKMAADSLTEQFCRIRGLDKNRRKLHRQLLAIQRKIADAEEHGEEWWLKELEAAAHAAVDVLDEFQYEALRQNAISQQPGSSAKAIKSFFTHENPAIFRYNMGNKLAKVLEKIDEIVTEMNKFNFAARGPAPSIKRETHSLVIESEVIGRDGEKEKIVREVLDPQRKRDNISVLAIVGMGGLGKTTLARLVYNDERVKVHFELLLWICVSSDFDTINISKSILEVATNGGDVSTSNKEVLQHRLRGLLDRKRYLMVLDDVWNEERDKWDELRTILFSGTSSGSVIIVTTRSKRTASIMETLPSHDLASLNDEDSWKLFEKKAFCAEVKELTDELRIIGKTIVRKCVGLPLALKAVGGMMSTKIEVRDWRAISESNILDGLQSTGNVLPVLKLSYDNLPSHTKQCFAFCAIFPQDYVIERDTLIQLWMANDFIPTVGSIENLEDKARHIFYELYWGSFFQDIKEEVYTYGSKIECKMHDLMHDLATQIAGNKCSNKLELNNSRIIPEEVRHLSINNLKWPEINVLKQFPNIHTYLERDSCYDDRPETLEKSSSLLKSCSLRVLRVRSNCLPKELGCMKHIRYLDLSEGNFKTLPETISTLYNLQTLILSCTKVRALPTEMRNMVNLRHLFLDYCENLKHMPIGLGQLKFLQTLSKYVVDSGKGGSIKELKNLILCGHMSLYGLDNVKDRDDAETVNLAAKTNLSSLELKWGPTDKKRAMRNDEAILEALAPHNELKHFAIIRYSGSYFPKWMKETLVVRNLKILRLGQCINCVELPPVWKLPLLENLILDELESLVHIVLRTCEQVEGSQSKIIFPALKLLQVLSLPNLESWHEELSELVGFPKLNKLRISFCRKLLSVPVHAPILHELEINKGDCFFSYRPTKVLALEFWKCLVALETLDINSSDALVLWPVEEFKSLKCLNVLKISDCSNFTGALQASSLPTCMEGSLPQLESLYIYNCQELVEVHVCSMSLKCLSIAKCPKISQEGLAELTNLTELRWLGLSDCTKWRAWPKNMEHLPSLKFLRIRDCPGIESFPEGIQQRLPSLQILWVVNCPALERRCIRGGDYWHLVSSIPDRYIKIEQSN